jgi:hypothetical protein
MVLARMAQAIAVQKKMKPIAATRLPITVLLEIGTDFRPPQTELA